MAGLLVVVGTRPEVIKLWPVIAALRLAGAPVTLCSTGQHRELLDQALTATRLVPDRDLGFVQPGLTLNDLLAGLLPKLAEAFEATRPDRVIVQGDTTSALAAAIAAHHLRIPVAHVEAGLRSGDNGNPWPEEFNRKAISAIADLHFSPTARAVNGLQAEGHAPASIVLTGNTAIDALFAMRFRIAADPLLCGPVLPALSHAAGKRLVLVTLHRRENLETGIGETVAAIRALAARDDVHFVWPVHPNPQVSGPIRAALGALPNVDLLPPLDYPSFVRLLAAAHLVLTDSGGVQEEAPALGKPVLILRETTERPEGVEAGTARLVGARAQRIVAEVCLLLENQDAYARMARTHFPYGDGGAAERIAAALLGQAANVESGT